MGTGPCCQALQFCGKASVLPTPSNYAGTCFLIRDPEEIGTRQNIEYCISTMEPPRNKTIAKAETKLLDEYWYIFISLYMYISQYLYVYIYIYRYIMPNYIHIYIYTCMYDGVPQRGRVAFRAPSALFHTSLAIATCYIPPVAASCFSNKPYLFKGSKRRTFIAKTHMREIVPMPVVTFAGRGYPNAKHKRRYVIL